MTISIIDFTSISSLGVDEAVLTTLVLDTVLPFESNVGVFEF